MDILSSLVLGLTTAVSPINLLMCTVGVLVGTLIGVLPGIGPIATIAMLLPLTFSLPPVGALIMLAGIYYGAQYGGSTTAILVNLPGEASSVVTTIDGHQMALKGRAGPALAMAAISSFLAGTVATILVVVAGPKLASLANHFGATEYFSLMVLGLVAATVLSSGAILKSLGMVIVGLLLGLVGTDVNTGAQRFTFGLPVLADGLGFVPLAMGMFGVGRDHQQPRQAGRAAVAADREDLRADADAGRLQGVGRRDPARHAAWARSSASCRAAAPTLASFSAYVMEKKISDKNGDFRQGRHPRRRRARGGQQCRGADVVHPDAHPRPAVERDHGADDRRDDHPRHRPGTAGDDAAARRCSGA